MKVVHSNSVVESKVTPGWRCASTPRSGLPSTVASPDPGREGAYGTVGVRVRCSGPSKKCPASSDAGSGNEKTALVQPLESLQYKKAGRRGREREGSRKVDGGREADGS